MPKFENLLLLLNLLLSRRSVSTAKIASECGISHRSVFRYTKALEAGGFSVYFDAASGGYRLANRPLSQPLFSLDESVIVDLALARLEGAISPLKLESIRRARAKLIVSRKKTKADRFVSATSEVIKSSADRQLREQVIIELLEFARKEMRRVQLSYRGNNSKTFKSEIGAPTLCFDQCWKVRDGVNGSSAKAIPLENVYDVELK